MQYLVSVIFDNAGIAIPEEIAAIDAFNDRPETEGHWDFAGGLAAPSTATVVDNRGGEAMFTGGPFVESKEYLAGFWIIEAAGLDVALKLRRREVEGLQPEGGGAAVPVSAPVRFGRRGRSVSQLRVVPRLEGQALGGGEGS